MLTYADVCCLQVFFHNTPFSDDGPYYAGLVTPVIHYCMGGLGQFTCFTSTNEQTLTPEELAAISADGSVLRHDGAAISGLYAAGEVLGGLLYVSILLDICTAVSGRWIHS
jgi:hypothetical protein